MKYFKFLIDFLDKRTAFVRFALFATFSISSLFAGVAMLEIDRNLSIETVKANHELDSLKFFSDSKKNLKIKRNLMKIISSRTDKPSFKEKIKLVDSLLIAWEKTGLNPYLLIAVIEVESGFHKKAVSHKGAKGLMQLIPLTAFEVSRKFDIELDETDDDALYNIKDNILLGSQYLSFLLNKFNSLEIALEAYNQGPKRVSQKMMPDGDLLSKNYTKKVIRVYNNIKRKALLKP